MPKIKLKIKPKTKKDTKKGTLKGTHVFAGKRKSPDQIKLSIRLPKGIVTSLTVKKNILALWFLSTYSATITPQDSAVIIERLKDFVYVCLDDWDKDTGKGLSDFVTNRLINDFLKESQRYKYKCLKFHLKDNH